MVRGEGNVDDIETLPYYWMCGDCEGFGLAPSEATAEREALAHEHRSTAWGPRAMLLAAAARVAPGAQAESLSIPDPGRARVVVIAERADDVIVVTPRSPHAAQGALGERLIVADAMRGHVMLEHLLDNVTPAFATREAAPTPAPVAGPVFSHPA